MVPHDREGFAPDQLWSLWDMLRTRLGRLLELHERLVIDKGFFERGLHELTAQGFGHVSFDAHEFKRLRDTIAEVAEVATSLELSGTRIAATRTRTALDAAKGEPGAILLADREHCGGLFRHLMEIASRLRDDCGDRIYFQIATGNAKLLEMNADHFGSDVRNAFGDAVEDIAEAASCLALERSTACVFHLMRALELAATVVAGKIGATIVDEYGKGLPWGVIADNMKPIIDKMPRGSEEQIKWYRVQSFLQVVNRAWRAPTAHPKKTYTSDEARNVFEATKAFMQELAPLA